MLWLAAVVSCTGSQESAEAQLVVTVGDGSLVAIDPSGTRAETLRPAEDGVSVLQPSWSPDGLRVIWTELDRNTLRSDIVSSDGIRLESPVAPFYYLWNPDGRRVAFLGNAASGDGIRLGLADLEEGVVAEIDAGQPYYLDWHPDGDRLAAHVGLTELSLLDQAGHPTPIPLDPALFQAPEWTPDGRLVVISYAGDGTTAENGLTAAAQGRRAEMITTDGRVRLQTLAEIEGFGAFSINPEGDQIAYTDTPDGAGFSLGPLRVVPLAGGDPFQVSSEQVVLFQWSPEGGRLLYVTIDVEAGRLIPQVWDGNRYSIYPGFLPTPTLANAYLPFWDQYIRGLSLWNPDGSAFAYPSAPEEGDGPGRIMIQQVGAEGPLEVSKGEFVSWSPGP